MYHNKSIAIDHGNRNIKTGQNIFTSGLTETEMQPIFGDYIKYNHKYYALSEKRIPYMRDKTEDERFFILTLFAIGMELSEDETIQKGDIVRIFLSVGLPPKHFGGLYKKFEQYFKRDGITEFIYQGKKYAIDIAGVRAYPQNYAASMTVFQDIKKYSKAIVIDIGGFTVDYLLIRNGKADISVCDSLEHGVITLYNQIMSKINSEYDVLLDEMDIDRIIGQEQEVLDAHIIQSVSVAAEQFVYDLFGIFRERGLNLKTGQTIFMGGGALVLKRFLTDTDKIANAFFIEDIRANAKGYQILHDLDGKR